MNHVLKEVESGDPNENKKAYSNPDLIVMMELTNEIINFINEKLNSSYQLSRPRISIL
jgi:hypothetical protein